MRDAARNRRLGDALVVIVVEQLEGMLYCPTTTIAPVLRRRAKIVLRRSGSDQAHNPVQFSQTRGVDAVALEQMLAQHPRGPDAKLRATLRLDAIAYRDGDVEVEWIDLVGRAGCRSMCKFLPILPRPPAPLCGTRCECAWWSPTARA